MATSPMVTIVEDFLADLARAGKSAHTVRAYRGDLRDFGRFFTGPIERITTGVLRAYLRGLADKAPATRARREAALAALLAWALVALLRRYLKVRGYRHGPLFRAEKNYIGGPLRYASAQQLWAKYREKAKVTATIHQLRHVHATELVNAGVSLETIRRRLGHANTQTVLRYADQRDTTADAEIRTWRHRKITGRPNS
jgi:site-specific recombinase XerD